MTLVSQSPHHDKDEITHLFQWVGMSQKVSCLDSLEINDSTLSHSADEDPDCQEAVEENAKVLLCLRIGKILMRKSTHFHLSLKGQAEVQSDSDSDSDWAPVNSCERLHPDSPPLQSLAEMLHGKRLVSTVALQRFFKHHIFSQLRCCSCCLAGRRTLLCATLHTTTLTQ